MQNTFNIKADGYTFQFVFTPSMNGYPHLYVRTDGPNPISKNGVRSISLSHRERMSVQEAKRFATRFITDAKQTPEWRKAKANLAQYSLF